MSESMSPESFRTAFADVRQAVGAAIVGHDEVIEQVLTALLAGGHCLLEGVPGIGKTSLVRAVADALDLEFSRIQFTPDLMPADVIGTDVVTTGDDGSADVRFRKGPIFGSIVLADEINRATPKTQSALLQAMEESQVTVARRTYALPDPFFVLATQNPVEMEGTYPLPEAQLDRFALKVSVPAPDLDTLLQIVERTTGQRGRPVPRAADAACVRAMRELARQVVVAPHLKTFVGRLVLATHPRRGAGPDLVNRIVRYGASPRAALSLTLCAKVRALVHGRAHVAEDDLRTLAVPVLRHRILLNFEGEAEGRTSEDVVAAVLAHVRA